MSHVATLVRHEWRLYAWATAILAILIGVSFIGPSPFIFCTLSLLERSFRNYYRALREVTGRGA